MQKADRVLLAILALSLSANLVFLSLWQRDHRMLQQAMPPNEVTSSVLPKFGTELGSLQLVDDAGESVTARSGSAVLPTVVYVLSPSCHWCGVNRQNVNRLADRLRGRYNFFGVSVVSRADWGHDMQSDYKFPIYFVRPNSVHPQIPLDRTPETLVFSNEGKFDQGWTGVYAGQTDRQVSSFFGVDLSR